MPVLSISINQRAETDGSTATRNFDIRRCVSIDPEILGLKCMILAHGREHLPLVNYSPQYEYMYRQVTDRLRTHLSTNACALATCAACVALARGHQCPIQRIEGLRFLGCFAYF